MNPSSLFSDDELFLKFANILNDSEIEDFGILIVKEPSNYLKNHIFVEENSIEAIKTNETPFFLKDKRLGISSWVIPYICASAYRHFREWGKQYPIYTFQSTLSSSSSSTLPVSCNSLIQENDVEMIMKTTKVLLLFNPSNYTCWNWRRKILLLLSTLKQQYCNNELNFIGIFRKEMKFLNLLAKYQPKHAEYWEYRIWLIKSFLFKNGVDHFNNFRNVLDFSEEMIFCQNVCEFYPRNYYCWTYRQFLTLHWLSSLSKLIGRDVEDEGTSDLIHYVTIHLKMELARIQKWLSRHISDHSGIHYLSILLSSLFQCLLTTSLVNNRSSSSILMTLEEICDENSESSDCNTRARDMDNSLTFEKLIKRQFIWNGTLILAYPGHESLWRYREFLWSYFVIQHKLIMPSLLIERIEEVRDNTGKSHEFIKDDHQEQQVSAPMDITLTNELKFVMDCVLDEDVDRHELQQHYALLYARDSLLKSDSLTILPYHVTEETQTTLQKLSDIIQLEWSRQSHHSNILR